MAKSTTGTLTQEMVDLLSAEMLITTDDVYLFYKNGPIQHPDAEAREAGHINLLFNRPVLPTGTYTETSRRLVDGTKIDTTGIAISMTQASLTVREYGGPHDGTAVRPFVVTEFLKNRAKHNVVALIGQFLRRDRERWLDISIMNYLLAATTVVTPSGAAPGAIVAGTKASAAWLRRLNKAMKDAKIPTFANGRWRLILSTQDEADLKADVEYREATRYFMAQNPLFAGHVMSFEGFDIMVTTMLPTTAVGSGGALTGYQSVAFGPYGIGHGMAMEPQVRVGDDTDYGREDSVVWVSNEALGTLYPDMLVRGVTTQ